MKSERFITAKNQHVVINYPVSLYHSPHCEKPNITDKIAFPSLPSLSNVEQKWGKPVSIPWRTIFCSKVKWVRAQNHMYIDIVQSVACHP